MSKHLARIVAFFLVPCLMAGPATVSYLIPPIQHKAGYVEGVPLQTPFISQALAPDLVDGQQSILLRAPSLSFLGRAIFSAILGLSSSVLAHAATQASSVSPSPMELSFIPTSLQERAVLDLRSPYPDSRHRAASYLKEFGNAAAARALADQVVRPETRGYDMVIFSDAANRILKRLFRDRAQAADAMGLSGKEREIYIKYRVMVYGAELSHWPGIESFLARPLPSMIDRLYGLEFMSPKQIAEAEYDPLAAKDVSGFYDSLSCQIVLAHYRDPSAAGHDIAHQDWLQLSSSVQEALIAQHEKSAEDFGRLISDYAQHGHRIDPRPEARAQEAYAEVFYQWMYQPENLLLHSDIDQSVAVRFYIEKVADRFVFKKKGQQYIRFYLPAPLQEGGHVQDDVPVDPGPLTYDRLKDLYLRYLGNPQTVDRFPQAIITSETRTPSRIFLMQLGVRIIDTQSLNREQAADMLALSGTAKEIYLRSGVLVYGGNQAQVLIVKRLLDHLPEPLLQKLRSINLVDPLGLQSYRFSKITDTLVNVVIYNQDGSVSGLYNRLKAEIRNHGFEANARYAGKSHRLRRAA
jgi:hypothetical protein